MSSLKDLPGVLSLSSKKSLKDIKNIIPLLRKIQDGKLRFPIRITCPHCSNAHIIRGLDDFPQKSIICDCKKIYLVKLVEVPNGSPEEDQTLEDNG